MTQFNTNQWIVITLILALGWLLGLFTMAGRRNWRTAFEVERTARIAADLENERLTGKVTELGQERESHLIRAEVSDNRNVELE